MKQLLDDFYYMNRAISLANQALEVGEVPVGALILSQGKLLAQAYNLCETLQDPTAHAEMLAISSACNMLKNSNLSDCELYVTLEPCPMCAAAIQSARIRKVVFGALDSQKGMHLYSPPLLSKNVKIVGGILTQDCETLLQNFFKNLRKRR